MATEAETDGRGRKIALAAAAVLVAAQAAFFIGWIWREHIRVTRGVAVMVRTVPVDPRDIVRGQYFDLSYEFDRAGNFVDASVELDQSDRGDEIFALLVADSEGKFVPHAYAPFLSRLSRLYPPSLAPEDLGGDRPRAVVIRGTILDPRSGVFAFGVNRFFVPEGTPEPRRGQRVEVELRVAPDMKPRIGAVLLDGTHWEPGKTHGENTAAY